MRKPWTSHEQDINNSWTSHELNKLSQLSHEQATIKPCANYVQVISKSWTSIEQVMTNSWIFHHEQVESKYWTNHDQLINISSWTNHEQVKSKFWASWDYYSLWANGSPQLDHGSILQAGTCQILSLTEKPRWSRVWQKEEQDDVDSSLTSLWL